MKCVVLLVALTAMVAAESFYYKTEDDYVNVDAIIANPVTLKSYIDCHLDRAPCNSLGASYKRIIADSVRTACDRCSLPLRQRYAKFLWFVRENLPYEYINYRQKYDPTGIYFDRFEAVLANYLEPKTLISLPYYYYLYRK